jgi:sphinganine-1-phosphate aldolase
VTRYLTIPKEPWTSDQLRSELGQLAEMKRTRWEDGKVSGAVYHGGGELLHLQATAMEMFGVANPIHPDVFPGVRKMEAEVVAMVRWARRFPRESNVLTEDLGIGHVQCTSGRCRHHDKRGNRVDTDGMSWSTTESIC